VARTIPEADDARYTVAHGLVLVLLLAVAVLVPWALINVIQDIHAQENPLYFVTNRATAAGADYRLYLDLTRLNDGDGTITFQATAQRRCLPACSDTVQLTLITAVSPIGDAEEWLPVRQALTFPPGRDAISQSVQWPVYGDPIRYPFDKWSFGVLVTSPSGCSPTATWSRCRRRRDATCWRLASKAASRGWK
jgi:hypothetical protein